MRYEVRVATINDWTAIKALAETVQPKAQKNIDINEHTLQQYLVNALAHPDHLSFLVLERVDDRNGIEDRWVCGMMPVHIQPTPVLKAAGIPWSTPAFVPFVYIGCNDKCAGALMLHSLDEWCRQHGAQFVYGNVREDGPFQAWDKVYGFKVLHKTVYREVPQNG